MLTARTTPAYAMTAVAGWIDTVGIMLLFEQLQIFPTYMSGNTTRMFVSAVEGDLHRLILFGAAIVLFVLGAGVGRWVNDGSRGREATGLLLESVLILAAALAAASSAPDALTLGLLAAAMGWNNVALEPRDGIGARGYITGSLVSLASGVADALARRGPWTKASRPALVWLSMAGGALVGAYSTTVVPGALVLLAPAIVVASCGAAVALGWVRDDAP
ncbi:MAG: YoaK family protein [Burkholderiales bacterium]